MEQTPPNDYLDPFLLALLMVLRLKDAALFSRLCSGVDGPEDAMKYLSNLPGGQRLVAERSGQIIEAYLIAADPDKERSKARRVALERQADDKDVTDSPTVKSRARELVDMRRDVFFGGRRSVSLANLAGKIDLAAAVRD